MSVDVYADVGVCTSAPHHCCWDAVIYDEQCEHECPSLEDTNPICYIEIPFEVGVGASFNGKDADANGIVKEKMYYKNNVCDDGKVFAYDNDANQLWSFCEGYYERDGTYKPQKTGYSFGHWEVHDTCNEIEQITAYEHLNTDLVPLWDDDDQLCKKIVAVWCNDAENKVPNENGDCVCKQGYYMDGTECKKCSDGLLTLEPGATAESECIEVFKYGTDGVWIWPGNINSGKTLMNVKGL